MQSPHVQVILGDESIPPGLEAAVRRNGACVSFRPLSEAIRNGRTPTGDVVVVVAPEDTRPVTNDLRVLFDRLADRPRATLVLKSSGGLVPRIKHPSVLPVSFGATLNVDELTVRIATMLEMRHSLDALHAERVAQRKSEDNVRRQFQSQLRLASRIQREFLRETTERFGPISFATVFKPADLVSGDIYDIQQLDEHHIGVGLADATGHGIPAALLTVFIKRAFHGTERQNGSHRILEPAEVLGRLNEEILKADLPECRFIAAVYAVIDTRTLEARVARGGSPYPILRRADGTLELLRSAGGVVGVLPETEFEQQTFRLQPGDALLLYSDGIEKMDAPHVATHALAEAFGRAADVVRTLGISGMDGPSRGPTTLRSSSEEAATTHETDDVIFGVDGSARNSAPTIRTDASSAYRSPDQWVTQSSWYATLADEGVQPALDELAIRCDSLQRLGHPLDDVTVVAIQVDG